MSSSILSQAGRQRVEQAIADVEQRCGGEIVVAVVPQSGTYRATRLLWACGLTLLLALLTLALAPRLGVSLLPSWIVLAQLPLAGLLYGLAGLRPVLLALTPDGQEVAAVHRHAQRIFLEHGVFETRRRVGILIVLSEFERRVEILADRGIHARVGVDGWRRHVAAIAQAARRGAAADGLCEAIQSMGDEVGKVISVDASPDNELSNKVITG